MLERKTDSRFPTLVERFVRYAKVHTTSVEDAETYPSSERQFDLARILVDELHAVGLGNATVDDHCYVTATLPASPGCEKVPPIAFIASRMAARSTTAGTPVKSCSSTRAGW